ncbi:CaiB/BaiF CoA transferase family protein [Rhodococcoides fascians]|uniref:CaiB/BaiF CoA transferase family protein n=1 Tax=Rhodococcoides fascians TaxID=1828 RepID=UPI00068E34E6|nr:CaiB/BaiF CoA-transferase family protein [Rhodococcus fascians]
MPAPLAGLRVVELAGIGPGPHAAMLLSDLGADVVRVIRPGTADGESAGAQHTLRGRTHVVVDLKANQQRDQLMELISHANVLIEGFRPGVAERLGVGPEDCRASNPRLVYGRMTGWGQTGPYALMAGHDINYISVAGALAATGPSDRPVPPLNLVGDYGGGSMFLVTGILAALFDVQRGQPGRVVDASMVDGVSAIMQPLWESRAAGDWSDRREANLLDGGAPFYRTYECADGGHVAVGSIEPQFYELLIDGLGLSRSTLPAQMDRERWPELTRRFAEQFATKTRREWENVFDGTDACVTPVLNLSEVAQNAHVIARGTLDIGGGNPIAAPAPRFDGVLAATPAPGSFSTLEDIAVRWDGGAGVETQGRARPSADG